MDTFFRFLYEFLMQFFNGVKLVGKGILQAFNVKSYVKVINFYKQDFNGPEWLFVVIAIILLLVVLGLIGFVLFLLIRKLLRFRKTVVEQGGNVK